MPGSIRFRALLAGLFVVASALAFAAPAVFAMGKNSDSRTTTPAQNCPQDGYVWDDSVKRCVKQDRSTGG